MLVDNSSMLLGSSLMKRCAVAMRATMNFVSKKALASSQEVLATGVCSGCLFVCLLHVPAMKNRARGLFQEGSVQTQTIAK